MPKNIYAFKMAGFSSYCIIQAFLNPQDPKLIWKDGFYTFVLSWNLDFGRLC